MPTSAEPTYFDSSALVKLVLQEPESVALWRHVRGRTRRASCGLARVEVIRAAKPHGPDAETRARRVLERLEIVHLDDSLLESAAELAGPELRSLDAIHLAAALTLGRGIVELVTYDSRMAAAAVALGLRVGSPR